MITLAVLAVLTVVVGVCAGVGWVLAHARPMPAGEIRAVLGPVRQDYAVDPAVLHAAIERPGRSGPGASVARSTPTSHDVNVRPSLSRTDDAMGLFVHIDVSGRPDGGAICSMYGQPKSSIAITDTSKRALRGFDRDLRMGLKRDEGIAVIDIDGLSAPYAGGKPTAPAAPPTGPSFGPTPPPCGPTPPPFPGVPTPQPFGAPPVHPPLPTTGPVSQPGSAPSVVELS